MIVRKRRTAAQAALLAYKASAPIGIGETREEQAAREDAHETAVKQAVRTYIWRTRPSCQLCRGSRAAECAGFPDEMHEEPSRAQTRGKPAEERFNLLVCGRLCKKCHQDVTDNRIQIEFLKPALGFMGPVRGVRAW